MSSKVLLAFYGVVSRSIEYTYNNLEKKLINVLKDNYDLDIFMFNNNVENVKVDGVVQNNSVVEKIPYTIKEEKTQKDIDREIYTKIVNQRIDTSMRRDYTRLAIINSIRQMYSEEKVGEFIEKNCNKYDCVIVCGPDYYLLNTVNIDHINNIINGDDSIYTTNVNDAGGYTNGFYIGAPKNLVKILKRFSIIETLLPTNRDYENLLKVVFDRNNVNRSITNLDFVKIRSTKNIAFQGRMIGSKYNIYKTVDQLYQLEEDI